MSFVLPFFSKIKFSLQFGNIRILPNSICYNFFNKTLRRKNMKFSKIVLSVAFAIIFSNIAYCDTLYKEQTVINQQKNIIEYISSDGNTTHKTLEKNSFFVDKKLIYIYANSMSG